MPPFQVPVNLRTFVLRRPARRLIPENFASVGRPTATKINKNKNQVDHDQDEYSL